MVDHTIRGRIDGDYEIWAYCEGRLCTHGKRLDLKAVGEKLGFDHSTMHADLSPKLKCSKCGSKKVSIRIMPFASRGQAIETAWTGKGRKG